MDLRDYQRNAVDAVEAGWSHARKQLGVAATGSGKRKAHNAKVWPTITCQICQSLFRVKAYRAATAKYCSFHCKQRAAARGAGVAMAEKSRGTGAFGYIKENGRHQHRVVAEKKIGRALLAGEIVHHIDGNKHNNSPENLQVMTQSQHCKGHDFGSSRKGKRMYGKCLIADCGKPAVSKGLCKCCYLKQYREARSKGISKPSN